MKIFDMFSLTPNCEKEINAFLKVTADSQPDMTCRNVNGEYFISFLRGNNGRLYNVSIMPNEKTAAVSVCMCVLNSMSELKKAAMEIEDNKEKPERERQGYLSPDDLMIELGEDTIRLKDVSCYLKGIVSGENEIYSPAFDMNESIAVLSGGEYSLAQEAKALRFDRTINRELGGRMLEITNNLLTKDEVLDVVISKGDFTYGGVFIEKGEALSALESIKNGTMEISHSSLFTSLNIEKPLTLNEIDSFDVYKKQAWKMRDALEYDGVGTIKTDMYKIKGEFDEGTFRMTLSYADDLKIAPEFSGLELDYQYRSGFDFDKMTEYIRSVQTGRLTVPAVKLLARAEEISRNDSKSRVSTKAVMDAFEGIGAQSLGDISLDKARITLGALHGVSECTREYTRLSKERKRMAKAEKKI